MTAQERIQLVLRQTKPLTHPLGKRLPLYVWAALDVPGADAEIEATLKALARRGIAACATWRPGRGREKSLQQALRLSAVRKRLGLRVNINASACTYSVFNGSERTAHVDADGKPFFDLSSARRKLGCPFAIRGRYKPMREQVEYFVRAYKAEGLPLDFVFADWEVDGPIEWNDGWAAARRCARCRKNIPKIDDFLECQKAYRAIRAETTLECYVKPVVEHYPKVLIGNYGVYPHDGWRYWYDYFEVIPTDPRIPVRKNQRAVYRPWPHEFEPSGYTYAMPVVYTRRHIWESCDWPSHDFRWFHDLLLQISSVGRHTPARVPIVSFVNYRSCSRPKSDDDPIVPMSTEAYKELLWHMLLRGHDAFFLWCPHDHIPVELPPLHQVFAESLQHKAFLSNGKPIVFDVPTRPGPVVSGLRLGTRLLVRRTDFTAARKPVALTLDGKTLQIPPAKGKCQLLTLKK